MKLKSALFRDEKILLIFATCLTSFVLTSLILRHGVKACSDSWFYWAGSVNLVEHGRYTTMFGETITGWPPLFSIFLALFQASLSQTGWSLVVAMSVISVLIAGSWSIYVFQVFAPDESSPPAIALCGSLLFVALFTPLCCGEIFAHALLLFFLGLLFSAIALMTHRTESWISNQGALGLGSLLAMGMLTHNSTIIFSFSVALTVLATARGTLPRRLVAAAGILFISLVPWLVVRYGLGQQGSHSISSPRYTLLDYVGQVPREIGVYFISSSSILVQGIVGTIVLAATLILWARPPSSTIPRGHRILLGLALTILIGHFLLFNFVWIDSALGGRFLWYFAYAITPILFYFARDRKALLAILLVMTVGVSGWRAGKLAWRAVVPPLALNVREESPDNIYCCYFLTSQENTIVPAGTVRVTAPLYHWQWVPENMKDQLWKTPTVKLENASPEKVP